jgi:hypothetical protein
MRSGLPYLPYLTLPPVRALGPAFAFTYPDGTAGRAPGALHRADPKIPRCFGVWGARSSIGVAPPPRKPQNPSMFWGLGVPILDRGRSSFAQTSKSLDVLGSGAPDPR